MIVFDLGCEQGHVFEAWFGSSEDYDSQRARGLISCPICNSAHVDKAVMAPRIGRKGNQHQVAPGAIQPTEIDNIIPPGQGKAALEALARIQARMLRNSDFVGSRFATEARAMHDGEIEQRTIHGQVTPHEARSLLEDGVPVTPLPLPVRTPGTDN